MNLTRIYESPLQSTSKLTTSTSKSTFSTSTTTTTTTILPGLISSLKPIKKTFLQLKEEETLLLNRFSYKNKNQYKSNNWWKKLIEINRIFNRLLFELNEFLLEFGFKNGIEETNRIGSEELLAGLLRLPRSILLVEKTLSVILKAAGIFEQLIQSKAFLSFSVVLVASISRLFTLSTILLEDLIKLKLILLRLISTNSLLPTYLKALKKLPLELQALLITPSSSSSLPSTFSSAQPPPPPPPPAFQTSIPSTTIINKDLFTMLGGEELGQVISRSKISKIVPTAEGKTKKEVEVEVVEEESIEETQEVIVVRKKVRSIASVEEVEGLEEGGGDGKRLEKKRKKKNLKEVKEVGNFDEIDDIFS